MNKCITFINLLFIYLFSNYSFAFDVGYPSGQAWTDINGDGRTDYCRVVGIKKVDEHVACTLADEDGQNSMANPPQGPTILSDRIDWGYDKGRAWIDVNADGVSDYCRVVGNVNGADSRISCLYLDKYGTGFSQNILTPVIDWGYPQTRIWIDVNLDGVPDFCRAVGPDTSPIVRCLLTYPESTNVPFQGEHDFPSKDEEIKNNILKLRSGVIARYELNDSFKYINISPEKLLKITRFLKFLLVDMKGDQRFPSPIDRDWRNKNDRIDQSGKEAFKGKEVFRGDAPRERIERAGKQA